MSLLTSKKENRLFSTSILRIPLTIWDRGGNNQFPLKDLNISDRGGNNHFLCIEIQERFFNFCSFLIEYTYSCNQLSVIICQSVVNQFILLNTFTQTIHLYKYTKIYLELFLSFFLYSTVVRFLSVLSSQFSLENVRRSSRGGNRQYPSKTPGELDHQLHVRLQVMEVSNLFSIFHHHPSEFHSLQHTTSPSLSPLRPQSPKIPPHSAFLN